MFVQSERVEDVRVSAYPTEKEEPVLRKEPLGRAALQFLAIHDPLGFVPLLNLFDIGHDHLACRIVPVDIVKLRIVRPVGYLERLACCFASRCGFPPGCVALLFLSDRRFRSCVCRYWNDDGNKKEISESISRT